MGEEVILTPIPSEKGLSNYSADTTNGKIWNKSEGRFLELNPNSNGYVYTTVLHDNGERKSYGVHRLVMASYSGLPLEMFKRDGIEVDHYPNEGEKWNNRIDNLQMSDRKGQYRESTRSKMGKGKRLKENEVIDILERLGEWKADKDNKISDFIHLIADEYGQGYRNIWNIVNGKSWKHLYDKMVNVA
ncbi:hypothetical protein [Bacillus sp. SD088]|uniref:hypothetical protein n=1 Tax=Bacillus sp. SD088 TaxID=2782012 RepID=UPI001A9600C8|nr:hypothetical protein [Bacillus sp. SD088]MBO0995926.1 hypothetical protein [Bacillus sp. SD088]